METQTTVAVPIESDGLRMHVATQIASDIQSSVAAALNVQQVRFNSIFNSILIPF